MTTISLQRFVVAVTAVATMGCPAGSVAAEDAPSHQISSEPDPKLERADSVFYAGNPERALELALESLEEDPESYAALWRAASYAVGLGVLEEARGEGLGRFPEALELAERARAVRPEGIDGRYWEVAALGRVAMNAGLRDASGYAERIRDGAVWLLDREPNHAGAHHALGRLYFELMSISAISRFLGRTFTGGTALDEASWSCARVHLERAVELEPDMLLYQLDLARLYRERGEARQARAILEALADAPIRQPPDRVFRAEVRAMLHDMS